MSYDSGDGYVLFFSGTQIGSSFYSYPDTWTYSGGTWTNITASLSTSPPSATYGAMVDDTYDGYVLLYGGFTLPNTFFGNNQTWSFANGAWTQLFPARNPGMDASLALSIDPLDNSVVLFGGFVPGTWTY
jgi:hypothetical protein